MPHLNGKMNVDIIEQIKKYGGMTLLFTEQPESAEVGQQREFEVHSEEGNCFIFLGQILAIENRIAVERGEGFSFAAPICAIRVRLIPIEEYH